jgi:AcrR family transcriptional regulator
MEMKKDRRVLRTKTKIRDTFAKLIDQKGLDRVTVKDVTDHADINRGTFYLHYQDKYDLLEQSEDDLLEGIKRIAKDLDTVNMKKWDSRREPHPAAEKYFSYLKEHAVFVKAVLGPKGDPGFQNKLKNLIANQIKMRLTDLSKEKLPIPLDYLIAYVVSAHLGVVQHWFEGGLKDSPAEMAVMLSNMNFYGPLAAGGLK